MTTIHSPCEENWPALLCLAAFMQPLLHGFVPGTSQPQGSYKYHWLDVSDSTTPTPDTTLPTSTGEPRQSTPLSTKHTTTILTTAKAPPSNAHTTLPTSTGEPRESTPLSTEPTTTIPTTTKAPPSDAQGFKAVTQDETSITLEWTKVDNISNYILKFNDQEKTVTASEGQNP
ncbi:hypothetical protein INR49_030225, partial [Caranx melampygus]